MFYSTALAPLRARLKAAALKRAGEGRYDSRLCGSAVLCGARRCLTAEGAEREEGGQQRAGGAAAAAGAGRRGRRSPRFSPSLLSAVGSEAVRRRAAPLCPCGQHGELWVGRRGSETRSWARKTGRGVRRERGSAGRLRLSPRSGSSGPQV